MKKLLMLLYLFFILLLIQCLLEASIYFVFLAIKNDNDINEFLELLESIVRYLGYRFGITVIPYLLLTSLISKLIKNSSMLYIAKINLFVNAIIVGFIGFYLESLLFDEKIFITALLAGIIILILGMLLKPKFIHNIIE